MHVPSAVDGDAIDDRVGAGKVDIFEQARRPALWRRHTQPAEDLADLGDEDALARLNVTDNCEAQAGQADRLGGQHVIVGVAASVPLAKDQRADAVGVAEAHDAVACTPSAYRTPEGVQSERDVGPVTASAAVDQYR